MATEISAAAVKAAGDVLRYRSVCDATDDAIRSAIEAALPHLAPPVTNSQAEDRAQWLATLKAQQVAAEFAGEVAATQSDVLDKIAACLDRLATEPTAEDVRVDAAYQRGVQAGRAQAPSVDYPKHWGGLSIEREHQHRERLARLSADEEHAVMRGHRAGYDLGWKEGQTAVLAGLKTLQGEPVVAELDTTQPTEYEMWRDAWNLAVGNSQRDASPNELRANAEWFHGRLTAGPPQPSEPDCGHCGADSSMDHNEDCPNAPIEWYVACGCSGHGDHLACTEGCADTGCQHRVGEEITASTEREADSHTHGPTCQRGAPCPPCHMIGGQHSAWCPQAARERSADQLDPTEDGDQ